MHLKSSITLFIHFVLINGNKYIKSKSEIPVVIIKKNTPSKSQSVKILKYQQRIKDLITRTTSKKILYDEKLNELLPLVHQTRRRCNREKLIKIFNLYEIWLCSDVILSRCWCRVDASLSCDVSLCVWMMKKFCEVFLNCFSLLLL